MFNKHAVQLEHSGRNLGRSREHGNLSTSDLQTNQLAQSSKLKMKWTFIGHQQHLNTFATACSWHWWIERRLVWTEHCGSGENGITEWKEIDFLSINWDDDDDGTQEKWQISALRHSFSVTCCWLYSPFLLLKSLVVFIGSTEAKKKRCYIFFLKSQTCFDELCH